MDNLKARIADDVFAGRIVEISDEDLSVLDKETARQIANDFGSRSLMRLPDKEARFFEWLREHDESVWNDLWGDSSQEHLYVVGLSFLPLLLDTVRGFPICDLLSNDNYYFTPVHILGGDAEHYISAVKERFLNKDRLTHAQLLALEISMAPIDIWRFGYHHGISPEAAKQAAATLVADGIIVHFRTAEQLANFVEFS